MEKTKTKLDMMDGEGSVERPEEDLGRVDVEDDDCKFQSENNRNYISECITRRTRD